MEKRCNKKELKTKNNISNQSSLATELIKTFFAVLITTTVVFGISNASQIPIINEIIEKTEEAPKTVGIQGRVIEKESDELYIQKILNQEIYEEFYTVETEDAEIQLNDYTKISLRKIKEGDLIIVRGFLKEDNILEAKEIYLFELSEEEKEELDELEIATSTEETATSTTATTTDETATTTEETFDEADETATSTEEEIATSTEEIATSTEETFDEADETATSTEEEIATSTEETATTEEEQTEEENQPSEEPALETEEVAEEESTEELAPEIDPEEETPSEGETQPEEEESVEPEEEPITEIE
jgi:hypothetical protein